MFRTELKIPKAPFQIGQHDGILTIGSCFSDNIGHLLIQNKFKAVINPFGTVYNPISINKLLSLAIKNELPSEDGFIEQDGIHNHFDFHSSFGKAEKQALNSSLNSIITSNHENLRNTKVLIITYGTAYAYVHRATDKLVANCHKVPEKQFNKKLLTQKQVLENFEDFYTQLMEFNPELKIVLTVSPVRHIKETLALNSVSKSILRVVCHTLSEQHQNIEYFPSYELVLDDLRDYRFYKPDMIHPTDQALEYIWNKFQHTYFSKEVIDFVAQWTKIRAALHHKPFNPASENHQNFIKQTIKKIASLDESLDFKSEIDQLSSQLV